MISTPLSFLRSVISAVIFPFFTLFMAFFVIFTGLIKKRNWQDLCVMIWGQGVCWLFGVKIRIQGRENIPQGGCLYLFNHTSFFDVFVMHACLHGFRFGAKIELFKIPIFGQAMLAAGTLPIARNNRDEVLKVYEQAKERVRGGEKFALSPEGGRQTEEKLYPFKAGPFIFAIQTQTPIVPVVILGAYDVYSKHHILPNSRQWSRQIDLYVLPPISTLHMEDSDKQELQKKVREEMAPYFAS